MSSPGRRGAAEQGLQAAFEPLVQLAGVGEGPRGRVARQLAQVRELPRC